MVELTKGQKKVARMLINKALLRECEIFLLQTKRMLNNPEEGKILMKTICSYLIEFISLISI